MYIDCYGLDYIVTKEDFFLLEINSGPALTLEKKSFENEEEYKLQSINRGYFQALSIENIFNDNRDTIKGITLYFEKDKYNIQIETIFETLKKNKVPVELLEENIDNSVKYREGWVRFGRLGATPELKRLLEDKVKTKKIVDQCDVPIKTPNLNEFKYEKDSVFPNLVMKPISSSQGVGVRFFKQSEINKLIEDTNSNDSSKNFYEPYIECNPLTHIISHKGNGNFTRKKLDGKYVYDIRITVATFNTKWYPFFELKRIAKDPIPKKLDDGLILKNYYSYLTNLSQGSNIGFLEKNIKRKLIGYSIDIMKYIMYDKNVGKIKNVFWTGGQSSTYRVVELLLNGYTVKPFYLCYSLDGEKGIRERIITMNKLDNLIKKRFPQYKEKLLPLSLVYESEIPNSKEIKKLWNSKKMTLPTKYIPLILFSYIKKEKIEICKCMMNEDYLKNNLPKLDYILFPNINMNKLNTYFLLLNKNCESLIDNTWSCDNPKLNSQCGKCDKCKERRVNLKNSNLKVKRSQ